MKQSVIYFDAICGERFSVVMVTAGVRYRTLDCRVVDALGHVFLVVSVRGVDYVSRVESWLDLFFRDYACAIEASSLNAAWATFESCQNNGKNFWDEYW